MSLSRLSADYNALPDALLVPFKAWARIDHDDDDASCKLTIARTIDLLERQLGILIAPQEWLWIPRDDMGNATTDNRLACYCQHCGPMVSWSYLPIPLRGVTAFTVSREGNDVSADFRLAGDISYADFGQSYLASANGVQVADEITLKGGATVSGTAPDLMTDLPPALLDLIFRYGLFLWENRESATDRAMSEVPDWVNRSWAAFWVPRV